MGVVAGGNDEPQGFSPGQSGPGGRAGGSLRSELSKCANVRRRLVRHTLEEEGPIETNALGGEGFLDRCTTGSGVDGVVFGLGGLNGWHYFVCEMVVSRRGMREGERWRGRSLYKSTKRHWLLHEFGTVSDIGVTTLARSSNDE